MSAVDYPHIKTLLLIAGLSGAGKSCALRALSDLGSYTVDNLPVPLLPYFLEFTQSAPARYEQITLLLDIDSKDKVSDLLRFIDAAQGLRDRIWILFLDAKPATILRRYSETRRPHPGFDAARDLTLEDTIQRERSRLIPLKERAQVVIDTSELTVHALRHELSNFWSSLADQPAGVLRVNFLSFGFKYGAPIDCDLIVDVRFLPNPFFVEGLRQKTGLDEEVVAFLQDTNDVAGFLERYISLLTYLLPRYVHEGKAYLNVGIGCTGGKHRSVFIAEELCRLLKEAGAIDPDGVILSVKHRDLGRE